MTNKSDEDLELFIRLFDEVAIPGDLYDLNFPGYMDEFRPTPNAMAELISLNHDAIGEPASYKLPNGSLMIAVQTHLGPVMYVGNPDTRQIWRYCSQHIENEGLAKVGQLIGKSDLQDLAGYPVRGGLSFDFHDPIV